MVSIGKQHIRKGEDEASIKAQMAFMKTECRKQNADQGSRMGITFPHRRQFINQKRPLVKIKEESP